MSFLVIIVNLELENTLSRIRAGEGLYCPDLRVKLKNL